MAEKKGEKRGLQLSFPWSKTDKPPEPKPVASSGCEYKDQANMGFESADPRSVQRNYQD